MSFKELLRSFFFHLIGWLTYTLTYSFSLPATPLNIGRLITQSSGGCRMRVEGTPTLKSTKGV